MEAKQDNVMTLKEFNDFTVKHGASTDPDIFICTTNNINCRYLLKEQISVRNGDIYITITTDSKTHNKE